MTLESILQRAKTARKHCWQTYEYFKRQIAMIDLSSVEYEISIQKLCEILEV